ncbi:hypothetical protein GVAV_001634 [Gurleya vavrai]
MSYSSPRNNTDMASALDSLPTYNGCEEVSVKQWVKNVLMVSNLTDLSEKDIIKLILLKLRGNAQSWGSETFEKQPNITATELINQLLQRFTNQEKTRTLIENFMKRKISTSENDFRKMLEEANYLKEQQSIDTKSIIKMVIERAPLITRPFLLQQSLEESTWQEFLKKANECGWIAFGSKGITYENEKKLNVATDFEPMEIDRIQYKNFKNKNSKSNHLKKKWCRIHRSNTHDTKNCVSIKILESEGLKIEKPGYKKVEEIEFDIEENKESDVYFFQKNLYTCYNLNNSFNLFKRTIYINNRKSTAVFDTGADVSIIHPEILNDIHKKICAKI